MSIPPPMRLKAAKLKAKQHGWDGITPGEREILLGDKYWRLNNLYWIRDKEGKEVIFKMNFAQRWLFNNLWFLNIILKARQMGFTTFIDLYMLDECLFNKGVEAGIIAHNKDDVTKIFRRKIQFPYSRLPKEIRAAVWPISDSKTEMQFSNGSIISVGVSFRSGTCQYLHISEHGKICAKYPDKAEEIKTGALEAVAKGQMVFIESTAEGRGGDFADFCETARKLQDEGVDLTEMDYRFHFFPWFLDPSYRIDKHEIVTVTTEMEQYFDDLKRMHGINLGPDQKAWYIKKAAIQGDKMKREYPSTPDEAFEAAIKGAYWAKEIQILRQQRRIGHVPHDPALLVHTGWDLGRNDSNPIWFFQYHGNQFRFIDFYSNSGQSLAHYMKILREKKDKLNYQYGYHYLPHDIEVTDITQENDLSRKQVLERLGLTNIEVVTRESDLRNQEGIDSVRMILPRSVFDKVRCDKGLAGLEAYQPKWDDKLAEPSRTPLHNWACLPKGTLINTPTGPKPVEEFVAGDTVSIAGLTPVVTRAQSVGKQEIMLVQLPNRIIVRCSTGHKLFTSEGLVKAEDIKLGMVLLTDEEVVGWSADKKGILGAFIYHSKESSIASGRKDGCTPARSEVNSSYYTGCCGNTVTGLFQRGLLFITSITTKLITGLRTSRYSSMRNTPYITPMSVVGVGRQRPEMVYDIEVEHHHAYVLTESGAVTSNSHPASAMIQIARGFNDTIGYSEADVMPDEEAAY